MSTVRNPADVHLPVGRYVHQIEVANPSRVLFISGQVGKALDGTVPSDPIEQYEVALQNVLANVAAAGLDVTAVMKLTTYATVQLDPDRRREVLDRLLGTHQTTSTLLYISALARPDYLVEIDAWAAV